jgi:hypothetical protein
MVRSEYKKLKKMFKRAPLSPTPNNYNFLGLVELLSKYDFTMHENVRRIISKETSVCYCSKTIQIEIISEMESFVRDNILERAKRIKIF